MLIITRLLSGSWKLATLFTTFYSLLGFCLWGPLKDTRISCWNLFNIGIGTRAYYVLHLVPTFWDLLGPDLVRTFALVIHRTAAVELSTRGLSCRRPAAVELWSHLLKRSFCSTRAQRAPLRLLQTGHHSRSPAGRPTKTQFCQKLLLTSSQ